MPLPLSRRLSLAVLLLACVGACASPAGDPTIPEPAMKAGRMPMLADLGVISLGSVTVGRDDGTPWRSSAGPAYVREALTRLGEFSPSAANAHYRLDATLLTLERPYAGFAMTVTATIAWRLTDTRSAAVVYDRTLRGLGTATLNDAVTSDNRLRIADQRAVGDNLQQLLQNFYGLPLN
jgi:hypothetical protein